MKDLLDTLKQKQLFANEQHVVLNHNFGDLAAHLVKNQQKNTQHISQYSNRYHTEIKQFAMTLHYYSPKPYEFVRKILKLPHSSSIRTWAANVNCQPGYLTNVIQLIGKVAEQKHWIRDVVLVIDAMICTVVQSGTLKAKVMLALLIMELLT